MAAKSSALDDLAAILERAEHQNTTPEEADVALKIAAKKAAKMGIDLAVARKRYKEKHVGAMGINQGPPIKIVLVLGEYGDRYGRYYAHLMSAICDVYGVPSHYGMKWSEASMYGFEEDLEVIRTLYDIAVYTMTSEAHRAIFVQQKHKEVGDDARVWRRSFYEGFISRLYQRLLRDREEYIGKREIGTGNEKALALIERDEEVTDFYAKSLEDEGIKVRKGKSTRNKHQQDSWSGMQNGALIADTVQLNPEDTAGIDDGSKSALQQ